MRRYHHLGIPTTEPRLDEVAIPHLKMHAAGFATSAYGIEWVRFEADCPLPDLVQTVPHVAFEVDDLEAEVSDALARGCRLLIAPNAPSPGVLVAFVEEAGTPVEFLQIDRSVSDL